MRKGGASRLRINFELFVQYFTALSSSPPRFSHLASGTKRDASFSLFAAAAAATTAGTRCEEMQIERVRAAQKERMPALILA